VQLHRDRKEFEAAGVRLVAIGQGSPEDAEDFRKGQGVELEVLVDPERRTYKAAGAKKATFSELLGPNVVWKGLKRTAGLRVRQGRIIGHAAQLGGVLIVKPDGSIPYAHLSEDASDNPPNEEVLAAAREAAVSARR
jgi:peroxiredoxin